MRHCPDDVELDRARHNDRTGETEEHPALEACLFLPSWPAAVACILFVAGVLTLAGMGLACIVGGHHG